MELTVSCPCLFLSQVQQPCHDCDASGEKIDPKGRCKQCNGKKVNSERKVLEVHIDKGMKSGEQITFKGESDQTPGLEPGDVIIAIEQKPHEYFQRRGNDLVMEQEIDLLTALGGGEFTVVHLDERAIKVTIKPGEVIKPDHLKRISGQGMPSFRHHELGDLYVKFNVVFPESIPPHLIPGLESALPARTPAKPVGKGVHVDDVELSEPSEREKHATSRDDDMDDDDEGGQGGGPGVQCAQRESRPVTICERARH